MDSKHDISTDDWFENFNMQSEERIAQGVVVDSLKKQIEEMDERMKKNVSEINQVNSRVEKYKD